MKKYLLLLVLPFFFVAQGSSQRAVNKLINQVKKHDKAVAFTIPGWIMRTGLRFALEEEEPTLEKGYRDLISGIRQLRFVAVDDKVEIESEKLNKIINTLKTKDGFEDYARVRDKGNNVHVMVREKKDRIKNLFVLVHGEDQMVVLNFKTDISMEELKNADLSFNKKGKNNG